MALGTPLMVGSCPGPETAIPLHWGAPYRVMIRPLPSNDRTGGGVGYGLLEPIDGGPEYKSYFYAVPESRPFRSLLILIHGRGATAENWFWNRTEPVGMARAALDAGFAVLGVNSFDDHFDSTHYPEKFGNTNPEYPHLSPFPVKDNIDLLNVLTILGDLALEGVIRRDHANPDFNTVLCAIGGSNGGNFVTALTQYVELAAVGIYVCLGRTFLDNRYGGMGSSGDVVDDTIVVPPFFAVTCENDSISPDATAAIAQLVQMVRNDVSLGGQPGYYQQRYARPVSLDPWVFTRLPRVSCEMSWAVFQALCNGAWIDTANGDVLAGNPDPLGPLPPGASQSAWGIIKQVIEDHGGESEPYKQPVLALLKALYAEHAMVDQFTEELLDFLELRVLEVRADASWPGGLP